MARSGTHRTVATENEKFVLNFVQPHDTVNNKKQRCTTQCSYGEFYFAGNNKTYLGLHGNQQCVLCFVQPHDTVNSCTTMLLWRIYVAGNKKTYLGLHRMWPTFWSDFNQISTFSKHFHIKSLILNFMPICPVRENGHDKAYSHSSRLRERAPPKMYKICAQYYVTLFTSVIRTVSLNVT